MLAAIPESLIHPARLHVLERNHRQAASEPTRAQPDMRVSHRHRIAKPHHRIEHPAALGGTDVRVVLVAARPDQAITQQGVVLKQFPPEIFKAFGSASGEVISEMIESGDDLTKRIAASYLVFREQTLLWTRIGDQGYANMRLLDYNFPKGS